MLLVLGVVATALGPLPCPLGRLTALHRRVVEEDVVKKEVEEEVEVVEGMKVVKEKVEMVEEVLQETTKLPVQCKISHHLTNLPLVHLTT